MFYVWGKNYADVMSFWQTAYEVFKLAIAIIKCMLSDCVM